MQPERPSVYQAVSGVQIVGGAKPSPELMSKEKQI